MATEHELLQTYLEARKVVTCKENKIVRDLTDKADILMNIKSPHAQKAIEEVIAESNRKNETKHFDHEEVWIATGKYLTGRFYKK